MTEDFKQDFSNVRVSNMVAQAVQEALAEFIHMKPSKGAFDIVARRVMTVLRRMAEDRIIHDWDTPTVHTLHDQKTNWGKTVDWLQWKLLRFLLVPWKGAYKSVFYKEDTTPFSIEDVPDIDLLDLGDNMMFQIEMHVNMNFSRAKKVHRTSPYDVMIVNYSIRPGLEIKNIMVSVYLGRTEG